MSSRTKSHEGTRADGSVLITKQQLAEQIGCTTRYIDMLMAARRIPYLKLGKRFVRFPREKVMAALEAYEVKELQLH